MQHALTPFISIVLLTCLTSQAAIQTKPIEYKQADITLKGYLVYDDAFSDRRPAVIVFPEWWGLTDYPRMRATQLAQLGYVAFAADLYGQGQSTSDSKQAASWAGELRKDPALLRARATAAFDTLRSQPQVDPNHIAAIGYCFGGTVALELARHGADLNAVCTFHAGLATANPDDARNIKARILINHGGADSLVPDKEVAGFKDEMERANVDWQFITYGHAKHSFTNPNSDRAGMQAVGYNPQADHRSWSALKLFLEESFASKK
jgi:dienelactone hydrolase